MRTRPVSSSSRCADQPLPLLVGGAGILAEPAELLVDRRDRGVGFVQCGERLFGGVLSRRLLGERTRQRGGQLARLTLGGLEFGSRLVDLGRDLQGARLAVGAAVDPSRADEVAVDRDGTQLRPGRDQVESGVQIVDHHDPGQQRAERAAQPRRRVDEVERPLRTVGQRASRVATRGVVWPVAEHDRRPSAVARP